MTIHKSNISLNNLQEKYQHITKIFQSGEFWRYVVDGPHQEKGRIGYEAGYAVFVNKDVALNI